MGTFSKIVLSGSTDGAPLGITGVGASVANLVHTAVTGSTDAYDEVWVWAYNNATVAFEVSLRWGASGGAGATTLVGRNQPFSVPARDGDFLVCAGHIMRAGNRLYAFATVVGTVTGALSVHGWVNRYVS